MFMKRFAAREKKTNNIRLELESNHHNLIFNYEFVSYSTIGFGDLVPEDEATVGGVCIFIVVRKVFRKKETVESSIVY